MFFSCPVEIKPFPEMDAEAVLPLKHLQHILPLKSVFAMFNLLKVAGQLVRDRFRFTSTPLYGIVT